MIPNVTIAEHEDRIMRFVVRQKADCRFCAAEAGRYQICDEHYKMYQDMQKSAFAAENFVKEMELCDTRL